MSPFDREYRSVRGLELRDETEDQGPGLTGYAAVYGLWSVDIGFREKIRQGAFGDLKRDGLDVRALVDHDSRAILARSTAGTLRLHSDRKGLRVDIDLPDTTAGRDTLESVKRGDLDAMSFGFKTIEDRWWIEEDEDRRELRSVELLDVSVVAFPAYPDTSIATRSLQAWRQTSERLAERGHDPKHASRLIRLNEAMLAPRLLIDNGTPYG